LEPTRSRKTESIIILDPDGFQDFKISLKIRTECVKYRQVGIPVPSYLPRITGVVAFFNQIRSRMPKNIGNFTTLLKPHNIGTHLLGRVVGIFAEFHPLPSSTDQNTAYQPDL
jgi:hypothetical protein